MSPTYVMLAVIGALSFGAAFLGTRAVLSYCLRHEVLDAPNQRSSHTTPTPRGGGASIAAVWVLTPVLLWLSGWLPVAPAVGLSGGGLLIALIGWRDDHVHVPARQRLLVQLVAAAWAVAWLGGIPELTIGSVSLPLGWAGSVMGVLLIVWMTNLYNFMDGIDGLAGSEAVLSGLTAAVILWLVGAHGLAAAALALACASGGFLLLNWPPARIFMGDVGSGTIGFAFGALALAGERTADVPALILLLPLGVFIVDATVTLILRLLRGERVYEAHRSHVYQRLTQRGWGHGEVTRLVIAVNVALAGITWAAWRNPELLPTALLGVAGGLVLLGIAVIRLPPRAAPTSR